jgi:hypothetical protein
MTDEAQVRPDAIPVLGFGPTRRFHRLPKAVPTGLVAVVGAGVNRRSCRERGRWHRIGVSGRTRLPADGLDQAIRGICRNLDIERAAPHDLRRTHGTTAGNVVHVIR